MMEFDSDKMIGYNKSQRALLYREICEIIECTHNLRENLLRIETESDRKDLLHHAKKTHNLLKSVVAWYSTFIQIRYKVGELSEQEYEKCKTISKEYTDEDKFWKMVLYDYGNLMELINNVEFVPKKGTNDYCICKGYYDIQRKELGRIIKKELSDKYPEISFSVTTKGSEYGREELTIDFKRIPSKYVEKATLYGSDLTLIQSFRDELRDFVSEYEPRLLIWIEGKWIKESDVDYGGD